ncbi:MAG: flavodoxin-dependent (E)-4-hydroxy-3-methylbut-2-enyl-diphosphate synthase [Phycisphaerales bacterium]
MLPRRPTRQITLGDSRVGLVRIGGGLPDRNGNPTTIAPVSVQTMTAGYTYDVDTCVAEINKLVAAGADIVRVAVPEKKDTEALRQIIPAVKVPFHP